MRPNLTNRQREVLEFVISEIERRGFPPSIRDIADHIGVSSTNAVSDHLRLIEQKGYIKRWPYSGIQVLALPDGRPAIVCVIDPQRGVSEFLNRWSNFVERTDTDGN